MSRPEPAGNHSLESLTTKYSRVIRSAVGRVAGPLGSDVADDIEQKVLIALWRAMPDEQTPSHPSSYLYRAAVRETVRTLNDRLRMQEAGLDEDRRDPSPTPERLLESKELGRVIRDSLEVLSPDRRRAVQAHLMGFEVREIMTMQKWQYNKARNLITRGMADLQRELVKRGAHA
ncbi:MAG: sigma-70 family RNA polymerase sigma factor [Acidobacteriota bacterium]